MTTLYRKYRPKTFAEIAGQEHIVRTLQGALSSGRVGHAYFFSGPRGTGKTTMARLFAKALNCTNRKDTEPCNACFSCKEINAGASLDLIEIDAASNRGIDEIRALKESAGVAASSSSYKVFIVDEVHMLTAPAFNALLKTLEEPPPHTLFVLATTESSKVPETILSRVQRFDFKKLTQEQIIEKLGKVAKTEKLIIEPGALVLIATFSSGSLRDAESALAKLMSYAGTQISEEQARIILGIIPPKVHAELLHMILQKQSSQAITTIANLHESGVHLEHFTKQFIDYLRKELIASLSNGADPKPFVAIIERLMQARNEFRHTPIPQLPLELAIVALCQS